MNLLWLLHLISTITASCPDPDVYPMEFWLDLHIPTAYDLDLGYEQDFNTDQPMTEFKDCKATLMVYTEEGSIIGAVTTEGIPHYTENCVDTVSDITMANYQWKYKGNFDI